jgi:hypothetical protein
MARDKDCFVVMTLAGAMTVAKQGLIIADLVDRGIVKATYRRERWWRMAWSKPRAVRIFATTRL